MDPSLQCSICPRWLASLQGLVMHEEAHGLHRGDAR
eukprot:g8608.t1